MARALRVRKDEFEFEFDDEDEDLPPPRAHPPAREGGACLVEVRFN